MSQFSLNSFDKYLQKALYIVQYLLDMKDLCIIYDGASGSGFVAYSNTDWSTDLKTHQSTSDYAMFLGNGIVSLLPRWQCNTTLYLQKQNTLEWQKHPSRYLGLEIFYLKWDSRSNLYHFLLNLHKESDLAALWEEQEVIIALTSWIVRWNIGYQHSNVQFTLHDYCLLQYHDWH